MQHQQFSVGAITGKSASSIYSQIPKLLRLTAKHSSVVWAFEDVLNGLMAIPNLIGLLGLSGVIILETKRIQTIIKEEKAEGKKT